MTFGLIAWEIDAANAWIAIGLIHRIAAYVFVRRPSQRTGRVLLFAQNLTMLLSRLTAPPRLAYRSNSSSLNR